MRGVYTVIMSRVGPTVRLTNVSLVFLSWQRSAPEEMYGFAPAMLMRQEQCDLNFYAHAIDVEVFRRFFRSLD